MSGPPAAGITELLTRARSGDTGAASDLFERVYAALHSIAEREFAHERAGHTLQPTAIVNEAWLKIVGSHGVIDTSIEDRSAFYAAAAKAMEEVLLDYAKRRRRKKRGEGALKLAIQEGDKVVDPPTADILALREAVQRLGESRPRIAEVVRMRYYTGCTVVEVAAALRVSTATVNKDWQFARAWLSRELKHDD